MPRTPAPHASLAKRRKALLAQKAALLAELAEITTQQRTRDRQERLALQAKVGKLADVAGLLPVQLDDPVAIEAYLSQLEKAFTRLAETLREDGRPLVPPAGAERT